jgi:predicted acetyltransferase
MTDKLESAIAPSASAVSTILEETSVNIEIIEARPQDKSILSHLIELYLYDFSEFMGWDVGNDGRFGDDGLKGCWTEPWRHPFLVKVDGSIAGFVIADGRSQLSGDEHTMDMGEFFILRKYRRKGIGYRVASDIFDLFPSKWEVRQLALNVDAQTFWRKVINRYTNNQFYEISWNNEHYCGVAQLFNNKAFR